MGDNSCDLHDNHRNNTTIEALRSQPTTLPGELFHQEPTQAIGYWLGLVLCYMCVLYSLPSHSPFFIPPHTTPSPTHTPHLCCTHSLLSTPSPSPSFSLPSSHSLMLWLFFFCLSFSNCFISTGVPRGRGGRRARREEGGKKGGREGRREGGGREGGSQRVEDLVTCHTVIRHYDTKS